MERKFTIWETNIAKGVACMLLVFHHLFYTEKRWDMIYSIGGFYPPIAGRISLMSLVCVAMFVLLSGYGLEKSAEKSESVAIGFTYKRLIKLYMQYWFVFILYVASSYFIFRNPVEVYGRGLSFVKHITIDALGLSYLFYPSYEYTMNATWWYMSTMILLYCLFPLLYRLIKRAPLLSVMTTLMLCWNNNRYSYLLFIWMFPFAFGIWLAQTGNMDKLINIKGIKGWLMLLLFFGVSAFSRLVYQVRVDAFFGLSIILIVVNAAFKLKPIGTGLAFIGKHSANIFMFHTIVYAGILEKAIYSLKFPSLIFIVVFGLCLLISMGLEKLKVLTGWNRLQEVLLNININKRKEVKQ